MQSSRVHPEPPTAKRKHTDRLWHKGLGVRVGFGGESRVWHHSQGAMPMGKPINCYQLKNQLACIGHAVARNVHDIHREGGGQGGGT